MDVKWRRSLGMGVGSLFLGAGLGGWVAWQGAAKGYGWFPLYAGAAGFVVGTLLWRGLAAARPTPVRGSAVGALTAVASLWPCWFFAAVHLRLCFLLTGGCRSSLGGAPMDLASALVRTPLHALWSLVVLWWLLIPLGTLLGMGVGIVQMRRA